MVRRTFLTLIAGLACWLPACVKIDASKVEKSRKRHLVGDEQFGIWLTTIATTETPASEYAAKDRRDRRRLRAVMRSNRARRALLATLRERYETTEVDSLDAVLAWLLANWTVVIELVAVLVKLFLLLVESKTIKVGVLVVESEYGQDLDQCSFIRYTGEELA